MKRHRTSQDGDAAARSLGPVSVLRSPLSLLLFCAFCLLSPVAQACTVCYGEPGSPMTDGARNGVLFLLGVIGAVQIGFVAMFVSFWRKAREVQKRKESWKVVGRFDQEAPEETAEE